MEKIFEQGLLCDFYGALLNEHQRSIYEAFVYDNLSLSEIAADNGISRQGVHDLIKRCDKILYDYESRLHLIEKFVKIKDAVSMIEEKAETEEVKALAREIIEEL